VRSTAMPSCFQPPPTNGDLGRNALRGLPFRQVDLAFRRAIPVGGGVQIQAGVELFNIFNIPNFGDPVADLSSGLFGQSTSMLNRSLTTSDLAGFRLLYHIGGPRSIQLSLRMRF
jgi:hypothetical protein